MQKANSLISLTRQILDLEQKLLESGGEITDEIHSQLEITEENYPAKVDNYAGILDRLDATELWVKSQLADLKDAQKRIESARTRLHFNLGQAMSLLGKDELEVHRAVFELKEGRAKIEITDESELDPIFTRSKLVVEPDKVAIKKAIDDGQTVTGAKIVREKQIKKSLKIN